MIALLFLAVLVLAGIAWGVVLCVIEARRSGEPFREVVASVFQGWSR